MMKYPTIKNSIAYSQEKTSSEISNILNLLLENEIKSKESLNMVPSENYCSPIARIPLLLDVYNRYFFNDNSDEFWSFRGGEYIHRIETEVAIPLLKELSKSNFVNLRPISGLSCMQLVINSFGKSGQVMVVSPDQGGHYATKDLAESFGCKVSYISGTDTHNIDYNDFIKRLKLLTPDLIYIDQSNCLFPINIKELVSITKKISPNTHVHVDASHWIGLIFGEQMENPLEAGADSFGGSTHKTFPGPQRAFFCTNDIDINKNFKSNQYFMLSSHHFASVISLAINLLEFKKGGKDYAKRLVENAITFAEILHSNKFKVYGENLGFTNGHQVWVSSESLGCDAFILSERLYEVGININAFDSLPGVSNSVIRFGVNEITRLGATEKDIISLAEIITDAAKSNYVKDDLIKRVRMLRDNIKKNNTYDINIGNESINKLIKQILFETFNR